MAGLVPAIHVCDTKQDVDARRKAGHDKLTTTNEKAGVTAGLSNSIRRAIRPRR
jgi:hypothetical protein